MYTCVYILYVIYVICVCIYIYIYTWYFLYNHICPSDANLMKMSDVRITHINKERPREFGRTETMLAETMLADLRARAAWTCRCE